MTHRCQNHRASFPVFIAFLFRFINGPHRNFARKSATQQSHRVENLDSTKSSTVQLWWPSSCGARDEIQRENQRHLKEPVIYLNIATSPTKQRTRQTLYETQYIPTHTYILSVVYTVYTYKCKIYFTCIYLSMSLGSVPVGHARHSLRVKKVGTDAQRPSPKH